MQRKSREDSLLRGFFFVVGLKDKWTENPGSDSAASALVGSDPHALLQRGDENLAVADLAAFVPCRRNDGIDGHVDELVVDGNIETDFREQVRRDLLAAIVFDILLASMTGDPADGNSRNISLDQRFANPDNQNFVNNQQY